MSQDASLARGEERRIRTAFFLVVIYNLVGAVDILSTNLVIGSGMGEEANPVMAAAMEKFGAGWVGAKLFLQAIISFMVFWFPHPIVLSIFFFAMVSNSFIVLNNFLIYFGF